jgi:hypothetical protein
VTLLVRKDCYVRLPCRRRLYRYHVDMPVGVKATPLPPARRRLSLSSVRAACTCSYDEMPPFVLRATRSSREVLHFVLPLPESGR